eukprot:scaffold47278_cov63-Phaeocystis_antarctica.AAC.2
MGLRARSPAVAAVPQAPRPAALGAHRGAIRWRRRREAWPPRHRVAVRGSGQPPGGRTRRPTSAWSLPSRPSFYWLGARTTRVGPKGRKGGHFQPRGYASSAEEGNRRGQTCESSAALLCVVPWLN